MWRIVQQNDPDDYVLATGESHTVREFVDQAFREIGVGIEWSGQGQNEKGRDVVTGDVVVEIDPRYLRPSEVDHLRGDASKARRVLGWRATTSFEELVSEMVRLDLASLTADQKGELPDNVLPLHPRVVAELGIA
jgi:GDPmannose 4,6-dehydratase